MHPVDTEPLDAGGIIQGQIGGQGGNKSYLDWG